MTFQKPRTSIRPSPQNLVHAFISCRIKIAQSTEMGVVFVNNVRPVDGLLYLGYLTLYE